jgi:hypothetical protein
MVSLGCPKNVVDGGLHGAIGAQLALQCSLQAAVLCGLHACV